jgi:hypothetical protein
MHFPFVDVAFLHSDAILFTEFSLAWMHVSRRRIICPSQDFSCVSMRQDEMRLG